MTKDEILARERAQKKTPAGRKVSRISDWKRHGVIVENDDWVSFYEIVIATTHCQKCGKELTVDRHPNHSTRCVDHDHAINNKPNVRYICCNACNVNDNSRNTSGEPNIYYIKREKCWAFQKRIHGRQYNKSGFKTIEDAIEYKKQFLENLSV